MEWGYRDVGVLLEDIQKLGVDPVATTATRKKVTRKAPMTRSSNPRAGSEIKKKKAKQPLRNPQLENKIFQNVELVTCILEKVSDFSSLASVILVHTAFHEVFQVRKANITHSVAENHFGSEELARMIFDLSKDRFHRASLKSQNHGRSSQYNRVVPTTNGEIVDCLRIWKVIRVYSLIYEHRGFIGWKVKGLRSPDGIQKLSSSEYLRFVHAFAIYWDAFLCDKSGPRSMPSPAYVERLGGSHSNEHIAQIGFIFTFLKGVLIRMPFVHWIYYAGVQSKGPDFLLSLLGLSKRNVDESVTINIQVTPVLGSMLVKERNNRGMKGLRADRDAGNVDPMLDNCAEKIEEYIEKMKANV